MPESHNSDHMSAAADQILALDVGDKRVGVAVAHRIARLARPLTTLDRGADIFEAVAKLVQSERAVAVVVGLPRGMDGGYTAQTRATEVFAHELETVLSVPVYLSDETLTSVQAEAILAHRPHHKAEVDALAAAGILESFLSEHPEV